MDHIARSIIEGNESIIPGALGRRDIAIIQAIVEAARTGRRIEVGKGN